MILRHKKTVILPSQSNLPPAAVGSHDWLDEHVFEAPETGAIFAGDINTTEKVAWIPNAPVPGHVLVSQGGGNLPQWEPNTALENPMTAAGDLIVGQAAGAPGRLAIGAAGFILTMVGGVPQWAAAPNPNPMLAGGDMIFGGSGGAPMRLPLGGNGYVLLAGAGQPAWTVPPWTINPMTGVGDLIIGGASGAPTRLGPGTDGYVLTLVAGVPAWAAATGGGGGMTNPMTTLGDLITGGVGGAAGRLGVGTIGHVLTVGAAGVPEWAVPTGGGGGGSGATPDFTMFIEQATMPDGTGTTNYPPEITRDVSTGSPPTNAPKVVRTVAKFDPGTDEHLLWFFLLPPDYVSGGTVRLKWKAAAAGAGNVIWKGSAVAITDGVTQDNTIIFNTVALAAASAAPGTAGFTKEATIALPTTGFAASRMIAVMLGRDADNAGDTLAVDAVLMRARFEYSRT